MDFSELSVSELVALCKETGIEGAHRGLGEDVLTDLLTGAEQAKHYQDPLMRIRLATRRYLDVEKPMLSQLPCDTNCPSCSMALTLGCYVDNRVRVDPYMEEVASGREQ